MLYEPIVATLHWIRRLWEPRARTMTALEISLTDRLAVADKRIADLIVSIREKQTEIDILNATLEIRRVEIDELAAHVARALRRAQADGDLYGRVQPLDDRTGMV